MTPSLSLQSRQDAILGALVDQQSADFDTDFRIIVPKLLVQAHNNAGCRLGATPGHANASVADGCSLQIIVRWLRIPAPILQHLVPFRNNHLEADTNNHPPDTKLSSFTG